MKKIYALFIVSLLSCSVGRAMITEFDDFTEEQDLNKQLLDGIAEDDPRLVAWVAFRNEYPSQLQKELIRWYDVSEWSQDVVSQLIARGFSNVLGETAWLQKATFVSQCKPEQCKKTVNRYKAEILLFIKKDIRRVAESYRSNLEHLRDNNQLIMAIREQCGDKVVSEEALEALDLVIDKFQIKTKIDIAAHLKRKTKIEVKVAQTLCKYSEDQTFEEIKNFVIHESVKIAQILSCHQKENKKLGSEIEQLGTELKPVLLKKALHKTIFGTNKQRKAVEQILRANPDAASQEIIRRIKEERKQVFKIALNLHSKIHKFSEFLSELTSSKSQTESTHQIVTIVRLTRKLTPDKFAKTLATAGNISDFLEAVRGDISAFIELERKDNQFLVRFQAGLKQEETPQYLYQIMDLRDINHTLESLAIPTKDWDGNLDAVADKWRQQNPHAALQLWQDEFVDDKEGLPALMKSMHAKKDQDIFVYHPLQSAPFEDPSVTSLSSQELATVVKCACIWWDVIKQFCNKPHFYKFSRPTEIVCNYNNIKALKYYPSHHSTECTLCIVWKTENREQFHSQKHSFQWDPYFKCPKRHERLDQTFDAKHRFPSELNPASRQFLAQFAFILNDEDMKSIKVRKTFKLPNGETKQLRFVIGISGMIAPQALNGPLQEFKSEAELEIFRDENSSRHGIFLSIVSPEGQLCHLNFHDKGQQKVAKKKQTKEKKA